MILKNPKQVAAFPEASQSQLNEESNMASTADIVHAYRRLSGEEEQLSESTFGEQSSSSRKKPGSHNPSRQQLPAKFECVAWWVFNCSTGRMAMAKALHLEI